MDERNIVTIDIGSSKIAIGAARIEGDNIQVTYYKESPSDAVAASAIMNETKARKALEAALSQAQEALGYKITQAVVGMPKYYIKQVNSEAAIDRDGDKEIGREEIRELMEFAKQNCNLEDEHTEEVFGAVAQSYEDGDEFQIPEEDIIGRYSDTIKGNFKVFTGKKKDLKRIDTVLRLCGVTAVRKYFTADTTAKAVLSTTEMQNGVALVDLGGGTASVSVYQKGIMRHYSSIPFGGHSISLDIANECTLDVSLAENIKKGFGMCRPEKLQNLSEKVLQIRSENGGYDKQIAVSFLSEIITARTEEIVDAVLYIISQSGCADNLRSGIVLTGGCAELGGLANLVEEISGLKTRIGYPVSRFSISGSCDGIRDTSAATTVGMMLAAREEESLKCDTGELETKIKIEPKRPELDSDSRNTDLFGNPVPEDTGKPKYTEKTVYPPSGTAVQNSRKSNFFNKWRGEKTQPAAQEKTASKPVRTEPKKDSGKSFKDTLFEHEDI